MKKYEPEKIDPEAEQGSLQGKKKMAYNPQEIEQKWQRIWAEKGIYEPDLEKAARPFYNLMMFPYPSGEGLHIGHMYAFSGADTFGRFKRMQGFDVFEPMGFDAFGIHSENYAIKVGKHPHDLIKETTARYRKQLKRAGFGFAWSCEVKTTDPEYYRWTQWIFLQLFKAGLAERKKAPVNWCPSCKTVLADEQVIKKSKIKNQKSKTQIKSQKEQRLKTEEEKIGVCERCETPVEIKTLEQWFLKITDYAEKLDKNLDKIDWSENVKKLQRNWIGRSKGAKIRFKIQDSRFKNRFIEVFTTRPDTIFGATFLVLAPEHPFVASLLKCKNQNAKCKMTIQNAKRIEEIEKYVKRSKIKSEKERIEREKTGVDTGLKAINPATGQEIPVWVADFVLAHYGGGAVMGVPAHDQRDFDFAKKYDLPIERVIKSFKSQTTNPKSQTNSKFQIPNSKQAYEGEGVLVNSDQFNGMRSEKARQEITKWLAKKGLAKKAVTYRLRDWLISRQRYWGPPIPVIYCRRCWEKSKIKNQKSKRKEGMDYTIIDGKEYAIIPVPEEDLPVKLPYVEDFRPTGTEKSPLAQIPEFVNTRCPRCGGPALRETDVSDNFLDSSWYFLAYLLKSENWKLKIGNSPFSHLVRKWCPVDMYIGGPEHAVLHLLYTRFITMALHDLGYLDFEEPFKKFRAHGHITKDGAKMSKSRGNVVNPDEYIEKYGADVLRMYLLFLGPFSQGGDFSDKGISGIVRFLNRVWQVAQKEIKNQKSKIKNTNQDTKRIERKLHQTIKKVTEDIEHLRFNTAIAALMSYVNELEEAKNYNLELIKPLILMLAPFAPHISEELYQVLRSQKSKVKSQKYFNSIFQEKWPEYDPKLTEEETFTLVIQINGKVRDQIEAPHGISEKEAKDLTLKSPKIQKWLKGKKIKKIIFVPDKLINFVVG